MKVIVPGPSTTPRVPGGTPIGGSRGEDVVIGGHRSALWRTAEKFSRLGMSPPVGSMYDIAFRKKCGELPGSVAFQLVAFCGLA